MVQTPKNYPKYKETFPTIGEYCKEKFQNLSREPPRLKGVARFGEPGRIHPLYKFCRWSALIAGITYGFMRNSFLQRRADKYKEIREKKKAERLVREAAEKIQKDKDTITELETITGAKFY